MLETNEETEMWGDRRKERQEKKQSNHESSIAILKRSGIPFQTMKGSVHYKIGKWNFWPSTGKFWNEETDQKGRGVFNLINKIRYESNSHKN